MKVNRKRSGGHHLPCLSGLSQSPLITDNGNERSTQITAQSLSLRSPNIVTSHHQLHSQPHQAVPISSTPQLPHSSASINQPGASIFFPTLPPRSTSNKPQQISFDTTANNRSGLNDFNHSPRDINMNIEHERNRETTNNHHVMPFTIQKSPPAHIRLPGSNSSELNSPLSVTHVDTFSGFFPESQQTFAQQQQQLQQSRRVSATNQPPTPSSISITKLTTNGLNYDNDILNNWPQQLQQDDTYHLYHEPIDPDEQEDPKRCPSNSKNHSPISRMGPSIKFDSNNNNTNNNSSNHVPLPPRPRSNLSTNGPTQTKDWLTNTNRCNTSTEVSPSFTTVNGSQISNQENNTPTLIPLSSSSFADRADGSRNDVSEDIYHRYVTLKSNERSNNRNRSYHGPKNTDINNQNCQTQSQVDAQRNVCSNSVAGLRMSPTVSSPPIMPIHFRDHCVRELIETESNYVHALEMIITRFAKPIESLLKRDENQLIFGHIRDFYHIHTSFQANLVKAAFRVYNKDLPKIPSPKRLGSCTINHQTSNPSTPTLSSKDPINNGSPLTSPKDLLLNSPKLDGTTTKTSSNENNLRISTCFLNIKEKLLKYGEYCATLSKAQALLDELTSKNETVAAKLDRCQQEANEGRFKLRDLLSLPMQRILKYHLLLGQLIKNTNSTNEDYQGLKRAHEAMVDLGLYINEVKRDSEAIQIINDIESSIVGLNMPSNTQLTDYGRLVTDGFLRVKVPQDSKPKVFHESRLVKIPHDSKVKQKRYVFVFDKVMLITLCKTSVGVRYQYKEKSGSSTYYYKEALVFSEYELDINPKVTSVETLGKHATRDKWSFNFNLIRTSDRSVYSFYLKSQELKNKWVTAIEKAMDNTRPASCRNIETNHEFLMHTFDKASSCDHCGKLLLGLYYQGYRCRICFASVHKKCLTAVRSCGPALPPKNCITTNTLLQSQRGCRNNNEPASPSVRSNCSDDNAFGNPPISSSSSAQCMETIVSKHEYTNLARGVDAVTSSSFRENGTRTMTMVNQRPVSSMVNVSLQNPGSNNQLLHQKRLLRGSASTPVMNGHTCLRARAIADFDGDEGAGQLKMRAGDMIIIVEKDSAKSPVSLVDDELNSPFSQLNLRADGARPNDMWFGKNTSTKREGHFPADLVELLSDHNDHIDHHFQNQAARNGQDSMIHLIESSSNNNNNNNNVDLNFPFKDQPWFLGRADRDQARNVLENKPHGTFLVRVSLRRNGSFAIGLSYQKDVKHIRIHVINDQFCLSNARYFRSLQDLITWYEENSLAECFGSTFNARLLTPYKLVDT